MAYHERGATRKTNVPEQRAYLVRGYRNRYLAMYKNMTRAELVRRIFPLLLDEIAIILLAGRYAGSFGIRCEAAWEAAKTVGRFRLKRKFVQSHLHSSYIRAIPLLEFKPFSYIEICIRRALGFIKKCGRIFLCQFELGRAILRRYYLMRGKPFPS